MSDREKRCKRSRSDQMKELGAADSRDIYFGEENPENIWKHATTENQTDFEAFIELCSEFKEMAFSGDKGELAELLSSAMYSLVYHRHGHFIDESDWLAEQSNKILSHSKMAFIQRAYTWAHIGCSTICVWDDNAKENVCMRSLDWKGARTLGNATRIFNFKKNLNNTTSEFSTVGTIGMLGVLTGMKKGFSLAINYAPWFKRSLDRDMDPTFKMRKLLENPSINTFDRALGAVENWEVSSPVFITICGKEKEEACVVEIGRKDKKNTRFIQNGILVQTNYYDPQGDFAYVEDRMAEKKQQKPYPVDEDGCPLADEDWYCGKLIPSSAFRRKQLEDTFTGFSGTSEELEQMFIQAYRKPPVWNWETAYWAIMRPRSERMRVFARQKSM
ncbi:hypothetical protein [Desulfogranum marinum]|uniref:hypothetical protein n=1 Tax=Desulfogranum marinum TaxID=453220 RepID=UPI0029C6051D|nr:hypothetical protein [Desulfogranum marinum]